MHTVFDVVVVGGGLVGTSLAASLTGAGVQVALIDPRGPVPLPAGDSWDTRIYAISPGSAAFLARCGAWQRLPASRVSRVETMRIFGDDGVTRLEFSAYDAGLPELAFILENHRLQHALWLALQQAANVEVLAPASCEAIEWGDEAVTLQLADGRTLGARLLVGADGADSWVRTQAGIAAQPRDYGQLGVVANFACSLPHRGAAYQWFRPDGVLALLPLTGDHVSMVWSTTESHGRGLLAAEPAELGARATEASRGVLGTLSASGPAAAFPLRLQRVQRVVRPRLALVGDAAHNVHPLAGQGVNLGFRDARELAAVLADRGAQDDCGDYFLLRRYERARSEDVLAVQLMTDGLQKLFSAPAVSIARARNAGMGLVDRLQPLKNLLVRHAVA